MKFPALKRPILIFFSPTSFHGGMSNQNVSTGSKAILQLLQRFSEFCGFVSGRNQL